VTSALLIALYTIVVILVAALARRLGRALPASEAALFWLLPLVMLAPGVLSDRTPLPLDHLAMYPPWSGVPDDPIWNYELNDLVTQMAPWQKAVRVAYKEGSLPLRNRWNGCGSPLAADGQSAPFSPFTLLMLALPLARAFTLAAAVKLFLALSGAWLWLKELRISASSAMAGAIAFAFSFAMVPWLYFPHTSVLCLWPWVLFAIESLRDLHIARRAEILLVALFVAWPLCGHSETVALAATFTALWLTIRWATGSLPEGRRVTITAARAAGVALGLTAFALLPQALAIRASNRYALAQRPFWSGWSSLLPRATFWRAGLVTPFFPRSLGDGIQMPLLSGNPGSFHEMALASIGIVGWAAALLVARPGGKRAPAALAMLVPAVVGWGAAIGMWPFAEVIGHIPVLRLITPLRFFLWLAVPAAAICAFELDRLREDMRRKDRRAYWAIAVPLALAAGAVAAARHFAPRYASAGILAGESAELRSTLLRLAVAAILLGLGLALRKSPALPLALLLAVELVSEGQRTYRFEKPPEFFPSRLLVAFLHSRPGAFRVTGEGSAIYPSTNVFADLEEVRTHDPAEPRAYVEYLDRNCGYDPAPYFKFVKDVNCAAMDDLNVRYLVSGAGRASPGDKWRLVYSGADGTVFENLHARERVFTEATGVTIRAIRETTNRLFFDVDNPGPRSAVVRTSDYDDGGWSLARGEVERVAPSNGPFLTLSVPPGRHRVEARYLPPGMRVGILISAATVLAVTLLFFVGRIEPAMDVGRR
jgi:hypothetical protein